MMTDFEKFSEETPTTVTTEPPKQKEEIVVPSQAAPEAPAPTSRSLAVKSDGGVALVTLEDQLRFAQRLIAEKMVSETFKTPQQLLIAFQYAKAMRLNEIVAVRLMYVVNGRPCLYGEGPLALCKRDGDVERHEEFFYDKDHNRISFENKNTNAQIYGACTRIWRKGDSLVQEDFFTVDDMAKAGLDRTKWGKKEVWEKWERIMLRMKARTIALRAKFPDFIGLTPIAEYDEHFTPEIKDVVVEQEARPTGAARLNAMLANAPTHAVPTTEEG